MRLDKKGKPIRLRLFASTDSSQEQSEAKVIAGWLDQLGLKITFSVVDPGTLTSDIYNQRGTTWTPDYRPRRVELDRLLRPRSDAGVLHDPADRQPRRALLVERPVRRAERAAGVDHRPPGAQDADLADAAAHVPADAAGSCSPTPTTSRPTTPRSGRAGSRCSAATGRPSTLRVHRFVPEPAPQDGERPAAARATPR